MPTPTVPSPGSRGVLRGHGRGRVGMQNTQPPPFSRKTPGSFPGSRLRISLNSCGFPVSTGRLRAAKRYGGGVGSAPPSAPLFASRGGGPFCALFCSANRAPEGVAPYEIIPAGRLRGGPRWTTTSDAAAESDEPPVRSKNDPRMLAVSESGGGAGA